MKQPEKDRALEMIELFLCPGCMGGDECLKFDNSSTVGCFTCTAHHPGTIIDRVGKIVLGLPEGFCRIGDGKVHVRLWLKGEKPLWNNLNVPVWALERDGYLFVRTYNPRQNVTCVDIAEAGQRDELCPQAIDVGKFGGFYGNSGEVRNT